MFLKRKRNTQFINTLITQQSNALRVKQEALDILNDEIQDRKKIVVPEPSESHHNNETEEDNSFLPLSGMVTS
jgi:hypothetical protein